VLADARTIERQAADRYLGDTITRQLGDAGLILLSKGDLVDADARRRTRAWLESYAPVLDCMRGDVALELLAGCTPPARGLPQAQGSPHPAYATVLLENLGRCDLARLAAALRNPALGVLRAKGLVADAAGVVHALQVVAGETECTPAPAADPGRLVCIGLREQIDGAQIRALAAACET
jgi:G3E family GTPase